MLFVKGDFFVSNMIKIGIILLIFSTHLCLKRYLLLLKSINNIFLYNALLFGFGINLMALLSSRDSMYMVFYYELIFVSSIILAFIDRTFKRFFVNLSIHTFIYLLIVLYIYGFSEELGFSYVIPIVIHCVGAYLIVVAISYILNKNQGVISSQEARLKHLLWKAKKAQTEAENANEEKSKFLANMSHEIRTPLNTIIGSTNIILRSEDKEKQEEYLSMIKISGINLLSIINDILDISKIEAGEIRLENSEFSIYETVSDVITSSKLKAKDKGIFLKFYYPKELLKLHVLGDKYRLTQVLVNLISNAIKFTEVGGVSLKIVIKKMTDTDAKIHFSIEDTGIGIAKDKIDQIFNPFIQAETGTTRKYGGTGLGLSICKKLLVIHNSELNVESDIGKGSRFMFTIDYKIHKLKKSDIVINKKKDEVQEITDNKFNLNILMAEDIEFNRKIMGEIIKSFGCTVTCANNGKEAVEMCQANSYDLVLMDIHMPIMDGVTAVKNIRESSEIKYKIPIYFLTADIVHLNEKKFTNIDVDGYLAKPIDENELLKVFNLISKKKIKKEIIINLNREEQKEYSLEKIRELSSDKNFIISLIEIFKTSIIEDVKGIGRAIDANDLQEIRDIVHKVSPSFDYLGMKVYLLKLENISKIAKTTQSFEEIKEVYDEIIPNVEHTIEELDKIINSDDFVM
jgi:signal transduction histidine kinase/DNA-binding NarL/FixJ family response regulator